MDKRDKKNIGILDKFQIQTSDIRDYHIIGIDPGAGEWSASIVNLTGSNMENVKDLYVSNDGKTCKDCSVLYFEKDTDLWIIGQQAGNLANNTKKKFALFENFKVLPDSAYAKECYDHNFENPTLEELMIQNFQCIVNRLLEEGINNLEKDKYIFFVGRPASSGWEKIELSYRDMLWQALKVHGVQKKNIQIAMVSEAQASLAAEIYGKGLDLESKRCRIVMDIGSSTIDVIVIKNGKLTGEYSRQIGAGCIEENMLEIFLYDDCSCSEVKTNRLEKLFSHDNEYQNIISQRKDLRFKLRESSYIDGADFGEFKFSKIKKFYSILDTPPAPLRFELRMNKEDYFGKNGDNGIKTNGKWIEINGEGDFLPINKNTMENAIYHMPIFVPCTEYAQKNNPYKASWIYRSYYDALSHFIDGIKEMLLSDSESPDVILTGGASVMPFVQKLIREKLGTEPVNSNQPSYTVSRGLAYIGYSEIKKQEELTAINQIIDHILTDNQNSLSYDIRASFCKWVINERIDTLKNWSEEESGTSLDQALNKTYYYDKEKLKELDLVQNWWQNRVQSKIIAEIKERFEMLYKNTNVQYNFIIHPQIVQNAYKESTTTHVYFSYKDLFGGWSAFWLNPEQTDYSRDERAKLYKKSLERRAEMEQKTLSQQAVIALSDRHSTEIITGFKEELYKDVIIYVEGLTPYIIRQ